MTPEAQRIAIAIAVGITPEVIAAWIDWDLALKQYQFAEITGAEFLRRHIRIDPAPPLPYYTYDLNAMHEAENTLSNVRGCEYAVWLHKLILGTTVIEEVCNLTCYFRTLHATAAQRAEAFLKTIGKWDDSK